MKSVFLSARNITFRYFEQAERNILENANLEIESGKVVVIIGNSGCGKSTLASVVAGLYPENAGILVSGKVFLKGRDLSSLTNAQRTLLFAMMFQNPDLQFCMDTLRKEMIFCLENICVPKEEMDAKIQNFAKKFHIEALLDRPLSGLSGGEKQKAVLCCLFLLDSDGFLLDEPFANLDEASAKELIGLLKQYNREKSTTIIAIDHKLDYWLPIADEIILLTEGGRILERGINKENLESYRPIFEREGLFYPDPLPDFSPGMKKEPLLQIKNLLIRHKSTGEVLLSDVNASFGSGSITALLGPSGCGKTTLFQAILKQTHYEGEIFFEGTDIRKLKKRDLYQKIGTVFQNPSNQFISTRVSTEIEKSIAIWSSEKKGEGYRQQALIELERYGLRKYQNYSPYMLSQGQQRRLAVLSVLLGNQKLLLLDEPTYGQDAKSTRAIMKQLKDLVTKKKLTVIFTTHDRFLAQSYADQIYFIEGKGLTEWKN